VRSGTAGFERSVRPLPGIRFVERLRPRRSASDPALFLSPSFGVPYEWQYQATHADAVPPSVLQAAASVTIAVIDTGADLQAPDLAAKGPRTYNSRSGTSDVRDTNGHGTFVASLAAGSTTNGEGLAGFGGEARLLVVKASVPGGSVTDLDEANAIVYAVDHGAHVINLSMGGPSTTATERRGIDYAAARFQQPHEYHRQAADRAPLRLHRRRPRRCRQRVRRVQPDLQRLTCHRAVPSAGV